MSEILIKCDNNATAAGFVAVMPPANVFLFCLDFILFGGGWVGGGGGWGVGL